MSFSRRIEPHGFEPGDWDEFWAAGWFRMRQTLFTTHFLGYGDNFYSALWLRVGLQQMGTDLALEAMVRRNRRFRVAMGPADRAGPPAAWHDLYRRYHDSLAFEPSPDLDHLLYADSRGDKFPTWEASLYDGDKLVAAGYFDRGSDAAAGIVSFYDPDYRKFSLGKDLIWRKMLFCRDEGLTWFYPGYLAPGQPRFDYKRRLGWRSLQWFDLITRQWRPVVPGGEDADPLKTMVDALSVVAAQTSALGHPWQVRYYRHLDINLNPQVLGMELFDFPVFLDCVGRTEGAAFDLVVFDPRDGRYHRVRCQSVHRLPVEDEGTIFSTDLLVGRRVLFSTADAAEMAAALAAFD